MDKYFHSTLRTHKEFEFQHLRHDVMSVVVHVEKFKDMSAYSRQSMYALDEKWKIDPFIFGLRGEISNSLSEGIHYLCIIVETMLCG